MSDFLQILKKYWGYESFRGIQREIIDSISAGKDTLGLMPTGGGKSITFQVPSLAQPGICIVITPLIALMKDQVEKLQKIGVKAATIYSGMSRDQILMTLENCIFGDYKFLYISPERLNSELFISKLRHMNINFITVDEAHCISQWGYDFRPSYMQIANIRKLLPDRPILALTATATKKVVKDIQDKLLFSEYNVKRMSFNRENLSYIVKQAEDKFQEILNILSRTEGPAIIYTRNRKKTKEIAEWLTSKGIKALYYHAGLDNTDKDLRQAMWQEESVRVIVATNAFGMGIDKPNVRLVIHVDAPDSPEAYFQEAGRAGRDGKLASAIFLFNGSDTLRLKKRVEENFPPIDYIKNVYQDLANYFQLAVGDGYYVTYEFNEMDFCKKFHYFPVPLESALQILTRAGYINYRQEDENMSRLMLLLNKEELYRIHRLPPESDKILQMILRSYGGIFSEYVYIEEKYISVRTGLPQEIIYETLKALNHQRILHYIPRKSIPYITYITRRIEQQELTFKPEIYDIRKKEYTVRIQAILNYATNTKICRNLMLLNYFGEDSSKKCGHCDICKSKHQNTDYNKTVEHAAEAIVNFLSDGKAHPVQSAMLLPFDTAVLNDALEWLIDEEEILNKDGILFLS